MNFLLGLLRPLVSRVAATAIVAGGAYIGSKIGSDPIISPEMATKVAEGAIGWLVLSASHAAVSAKTNPTNSATGVLAASKPAEVIPKSQTPIGVAAVENKNTI